MYRNLIITDILFNNCARLQFFLNKINNDLKKSINTCEKLEYYVHIAFYTIEYNNRRSKLAT